MSRNSPPGCKFNLPDSKTKVKAKQCRKCGDWNKGVVENKCYKCVGKNESKSQPASNNKRDQLLADAKQTIPVSKPTQPISLVPDDFPSLGSKPSKPSPTPAWGKPGPNVSKAPPSKAWGNSNLIPNGPNVSLSPPPAAKASAWGSPNAANAVKPPPTQAWGNPSESVTKTEVISSDDPKTNTPKQGVQISGVLVEAPPKKGIKFAPEGDLVEAAPKTGVKFAPEETSLGERKDCHEDAVENVRQQLTGWEIGAKKIDKREQKMVNHVIRKGTALTQANFDSDYAKYERVVESSGNDQAEVWAIQQRHQIWVNDDVEYAYYFVKQIDTRIPNKTTQQGGRLYRMINILQNSCVYLHDKMNAHPVVSVLSQNPQDEVRKKFLAPIAKAVLEIIEDEEEEEEAGAGGVYSDDDY